MCKIPAPKKRETLNQTSIAARQRLSAATRMLLRPDSSHGALFDAVHAMLALFAEISGLSDQDGSTADLAASCLPDGTAISPRDAARCLLDFYRTTCFLRGMHAAINTARQRFPGQTIEIVYAGCGPYATLVLPLFTCFAPGQIRCTLIDIHQRALDSARELVERCGYGEFIRAYVREDATRYRHPPELPLHLALTETMQKALAKEPQFAVTANLVPQLCAGGILVPECITVDFCLADLGREFQVSGPNDSDIPTAARVRLGRQTLLVLSARNVGEQVAQQAFDPKHAASMLPAQTVRMPVLPQPLSALLLTRVQVFGEFALDDYDSGLSYPAVLHDLGSLREGDLLEFRYRLGGNPGFVAERVAPGG